MAKSFVVYLCLVCGLLFSWAEAYEPCGVNLESVRPSSGEPGTEIELIGKWGDTQGKKIPCINKGGSNRLEILEWTDRVIRARVPKNLGGGGYKVGVYCNDLSEGGSYSSGWTNFEVINPAAADSNNAAPLVSAERTVQNENRRAPSSSQPARSAEPSKKWLDFILHDKRFLGVLAVVSFLLLIKRRRQETVNHHLRQTTPQNTPSPSTAVPPESKGTVMGVPYLAESYDGQSLTISIDANKKIATPIEVNARAKRPPVPPGPVSGEIEALLNQGADYIDIAYNTNWIAAGFPLGVASRFSQTEKERLVQQLIRIRSLLE